LLEHRRLWLAEPLGDTVSTGSTLQAATDQPLQTSNGRAYLFVLLAALLLYVISAAPGPLWQDSGLAQLRVLRRDLHGALGLALAHPLYYVFGIAFQVLPLGESAWKTNLVSAVFGAVTVANVFLLLRLLTPRVAGATVGTVALAVAHTFWQHCALAEVYTVSTSLLTAELLCATMLVRTGRARWLVLLAATNGLGISNHMLAVLGLPVWGTLIAWLLWRRRVACSALAWAAAAWCGGAALYGTLIVGELAHGTPAGDVLRSALFGSQYADNVLNAHLSLGLLVRSGEYLGLNFPTPMFLLIVPGLAMLRRLPERPVGAAIGALLAIHLVWAVRYDVPDQYTFFIPAVVYIAIVLGLGAARLLERWPRMSPAVLVALAALPALVYVPLPWAARKAGLELGTQRKIPYRDEYRYFLRPWKTGESGPWRLATEARDIVLSGGAVIGDWTSAQPFHYLALTGRWDDTVQIWPGVEGRQEHFWPTETDLAGPLSAGTVYVVSSERGHCPAWILDRYALEPAGPVERVASEQASGAEGP
jgi:hypothetical protein